MLRIWLLVILTMGAGCDGGFLNRSPLDRVVQEVVASADIFIATHEGNAVARHGSSLLVANGQTSGFFQVIDSAGHLLRNVGRQGEGPEEFGFVQDVAVSSDGSVWVWDSRNSRLALLDRDLDFVTTYPVPFRAQNMQGHSLRVLESGDLLLLGCWDSPGNCGVHRWSPEEVVWSFVVPPARDRSRPFVSVHEAGDGRIWVVEQFSYRLWELDSAGAVVREGAVLSDWFTDWSQQAPPAGAPSADEAERTGSVAMWSPLARVLDVRADDRRILVLGVTGDPAWASAGAGGYHDVGQYFDAVLEALDPVSLEVLESVKFHIEAGMPTKFLSDREILVAETHPLFDRLTVWAMRETFGTVARNAR